MRSLIIGLCIIAQLTILAAMVYTHEMVIRSGERIYLRTAPIDPRDPFRGDFVRLRYTMNSASAANVRWKSTKNLPKRGDKIFASLSESFNSIYQVAYVTDVRPDNGLFIAGRVTRTIGSPSEPAEFKFGIEQYFVEQGHGIEIEQRQGVRGGMQVPLEMEVAVNQSGKAIITGSRWSSLGIEMQLISLNAAAQEVTENTPNNDNQSVDTTTETDRPQPSLRIRLQNTSLAPLTINNPGNNCGFNLERANPNNRQPKTDTNPCKNVLADTLLTLQADESHTVDIDLADSRWHVLSSTGSSVDLRELNANEWFRVVFRSEASSQTNTKGLWQGELPSQAFNARGRID